MTRNPLRLLLTVMPICLAFSGFALIFGLNNAYEFSRELDDARRLVTINRQSIIQPLPERLAQQVADIDGVERVTFASWFGGYHENPENRFSQYAVDSESYLAVYDSIQLDSAARTRWLQDPRSVLISDHVARRFDWGVGDTISLTSTIWQRNDFQADWVLEVGGIFSAEEAGIEPEIMLIKHDFFNRNRLFGSGTISFVVSRVAPSFELEKVVRAIDAMSQNSATPSYTSKESVFVESFQRQLGDLALLTELVVATVVGVVLLLTSSSLAQSIFERRRQISILSAIGYSKPRIGYMLAVEALLTVLAAAILSVLLAHMVAALLSAILIEGPFSKIELNPMDILQITAVALALGVAGSTLPLVRLMREDLSRNLKGE